jgi:hypothetical protein
MAALTSITYKTPTGRPDSIGFNGAVVVAQGTLPSGQATATCPIGDLSATDIVLVLVTTAAASCTIPIVEILASRTTGGAGVVTVGTQDGSNAAADHVLWVVKLKI